MTLILDLTPGEQARLRQLAAQRGRQEQEQAQEMFRRSLDSEWPEEENAGHPSEDEQEHLMSAVRAGDKEAWHKLLRLSPPVSLIVPETGEPAVISDESLRRENMYEDRA